MHNLASTLKQKLHQQSSKNIKMKLTSGVAIAKWQKPIPISYEDTP